MANLCKLKPVGYSDGSDPFNIYNFLKKSQLVPNTTVQPSNLPEPLDTCDSCETRPPGNLSSIAGRRSCLNGLVKIDTMCGYAFRRQPQACTKKMTKVQQTLTLIISVLVC